MPGNVVIMLIFEMTRINEGQKGSTLSFLFLFFFFDNAKKLGRSDDGKRRKRGDALLIYLFGSLSRGVVSVPSNCTEAHVPTPWYAQYLTHAHNHITRAVAAMDSCFALVGAHQHGITVGSLSRD